MLLRRIQWAQPLESRRRIFVHNVNNDGSAISLLIFICLMYCGFAFKRALYGSVAPFGGSTNCSVALLNFASSFVPNLKIRNFPRRRFMIGMEMPDRWTIVSLSLSDISVRPSRIHLSTICGLIVSKQRVRNFKFQEVDFRYVAHDAKPTVC